MGKSLPSTAVMKNIARIFSSEGITPLKQVKPKSNNKVSASISQSAKQPTKITPVDSVQLGLKIEGDSVVQNRFPLREVVSSCVKRWFRDTLKEAKAGDPAMQILVGQMYNSGYGVRKNTQKGCTWIIRATKGRSSAWKVRNKQPGYNISDSDSDSPDLKDNRS